MKTDKYNQLIDALESRLIACALHLGNIHTTEDLKKKTIEELLEIREFCRSEEKKMSRFALIELYHIIGMANMSPSQEAKFLKLVRKYLSYRPDIKSIAATLDSIDALPKIPKKTKFHLSAITSMWLGYSRDGEVSEDDDEAEEETDEMPGPKAPTSLVDNLPYTLDGVTLHVPEERLNDFYEFITVGYNGASKPAITKLAGKMARPGSEYMGIRWMGKSGDGFIGIVNDANTLRTLKC